MIDDLLCSQMKNDGTVGGFVITGTQTRIYQIRLPQAPTFPAITIQRVSSGGRELSHSGSTQAARPTFQVTCFAESPREMRELAEAVVELLHGWKAPEADPEIFSTSVVNETDLTDTETGVYMTAIDIEIFHRE